LAEEYRCFRGITLKGIETAADKALCLNVIKYIKKDYDHIIVCNMATPTGMLAITYMKLLGIKYIIEGDGAFPSDTLRIKDKVKNILEVNSQGESFLAQFYSLTYIGDYASTYLALEYGLNPTPVKVIDYLKAELAK
jgi:hypothetical protein